MESEWKPRLVVLALDVDDEPQAVRRFLQERKLSYTVLVAGRSNSPIPKIYGLGALPLTMSIKFQGRHRLPAPGHGGLRCRGSVILGRHKCPVLAIYREQIRHHLPRHCKGRSIGISLLFFLLIDQGQFVVLFGRQLRSFHQHALDMFIALFGKRCSS